MKELRETIHNANLTKTQKVIAKFILDNSADACFMTSTEIALKLGVSESSVIRFSRSLGYIGFMDFQKALRKDYQGKVLSISSNITVPSQRIAKRAKLENSSDYINRHFKNAVKNLENVFAQNSIQTFEEAADIIISSKRKYIAASRGNTCLSDYFLLYLKQMVPHVVMTNTNSISPIDHMCNISKEDCLIIFSFPRYSSMDKITAEMAHDAGASIIVITDKPSALLSQYATVLLTVSVDSNAFFNSLVGPQFVVEALLETISHKVKGIEKRLKKIDQYLGRLGNY
ncbi:MAG: MurR/RpiR family transcriptional regulator [Dorea sp.]|nr:MurR/RpiR family transcriptional regulator [Dorea sp.]MDY2813165.1 MurR/RpiR family transcriptional regulator [Dorea sp.]